ncbi:MAG TPA: FHA domain-containing protein [Thermoanaerobaculia bacterium]|nr:FHA domain-containing protein [Thermoanaerobaculia bacterium]
MIIECDRCYARYKYDETRFEGKPSKKVRCTKCLSVFEIYNTHAEEAAPPVAMDTPQDTVFRLAEDGERKPSETTRKSVATASPRRAAGELKLPTSAKLSLAVIAGPESGKIFLIERPRVVIGRHDADINVDDPEVSRQHAALEISNDRITLVDLGSTNGTFMGDEPVTETSIENQGEFTIGGSTIMLIVTPRG